MADETPSLQIDTDWKKQAQEEKRKLAEQQKSPPPPTTGGPTVSPSRGAAGEGRDPRAGREIPPASFATLVQGIVTQALFSLGDIAMRGSQPAVDLDLAKHHIDTLSIIEQKTAGNLSADEKRMLDSALYEVRMRYVNVATQYIS